MGGTNNNMESIISTHNTQTYDARFEVAFSDVITVEGVLHTTDVMEYDHEAGLHLPISTEHSFVNVEIWHWSDDGIIAWSEKATEAWLEQHQAELLELIHDMLADDPNC